MKRTLLLAALAGALATPAFSQTPAAPGLAPLTVSADGHRLQSEGKPFLWIGDTAWGMLQYLTREQVDEYLDNRQALGFTLIQTVAHWYPHGGGLASGPSNSPNAYGFRPFEGSPDAPDVLRPLVVPGGSPEAPNDYWDHADYVVNAIKKRNMYLGLLPIWGRAYVTSTFGGTRQLYNEQSAKSFGAFLGNRYRDEKHIVWIMGGDTKAQVKGFDKNQNYQDFDARPIFRAMAEGVTRGVTGKSVSWNTPDPAWDRVLITYHPDGDSYDNSSKWFHGETWLDFNGVEVWREMDDVYPVMLGEYQLSSPVKPSVFLEGSYEYGSYRYECGAITPLKVRRQFYQTFFAGGAGHTYGAGPIWAMRGDSGDYNCGYSWQQALTFPAAKQVADIGHKFLAANGWENWKPSGKMLDGVGDRQSRKSGIVTASGDRAIVYFADSSAGRIRNILAGRASATWFDPRDGREVKAGYLAKDEMREMLPPDRWEDAILILKLD